MRKDVNRKYHEKFKFANVRFTPKQMADLDEYCRENNVSKSAFMQNEILKKIYGGTNMVITKKNWQFAIIDCWNEHQISKSEANRLIDIGGNLDEIMEVDLNAVDKLYPFLPEDDAETLKCFIKNKFDFDEA